MLKFSLLVTLLSAALANAVRRTRMPLITNGLKEAPVPGYHQIYNGTFEQLIDHTNPSLGTFSQEWFYDTRHWGGPGSPIILLAPQEVNASESLIILTDLSLLPSIAKEMGAALLTIEHRYWGNSSPFPVLSTENMQYMTLENAIADLIYFAENVDLPFTSNSNAEDVPWVLVGGSYSAALTAWVAAKAPGTYWAYWATSAVVEAYSDLWLFFKQIEDGMPKNCSADAKLVVQHMDSVFESGSAKEQHELKAMFGLEDLEHADDVMNFLTYGPELFQNPTNMPDGFYTWCDYVEDSVNVTDKNKLPGASGVGLDKALAGWAKWVKTQVLPTYCYDGYGYEVFNTTNNVMCLDTYNASNPLFTDMTVSNTADRQWEWFLCNQPFGWWQGGPPKNHAGTIASKLVTPEYNVRQCGLYFPPGPNGQTFGLNGTRTYAEQNSYTGGWFIDNTTRLTYTNGQYDPWRDTTVSSFIRPGGPLESTAQVPVNVVPDGNHCSDFWVANGESDPGCKAIQESETAQLIAWVKEWPSEKRRLVKREW